VTPIQPPADLPEHIVIQLISRLQKSGYQRKILFFKKVIKI
jgi:hypothetical protein